MSGAAESYYDQHKVHQDRYSETYAISSMDTRSSNESAPGLFTIGVANNDRNRCAVWRSIGASDGNIGQESEAIILSDETTSCIPSSVI